MGAPTGVMAPFLSRLASSRQIVPKCRAYFGTHNAGSANGKRAVRAGAVLLATSGALLYYVRYLKGKQDEHKPSRLTDSEDFGTPQLGASFVLCDHLGRPFDSQQQLSGKVALLYFGFTHCPDVCPEELDKLGRIIAGLKTHGIHIVPLFVSCDPVRDTPAVMHDYLKDFDPDIVGLTVAEGGDTAPLQAMAKAFRVYFRPAKTSIDEDYLLDHSIFLYLLKDGQFVKVFGRSTSSEQVVADIVSLSGGK